MWYYVFVEGGLAPKKRHETIEDANVEAKRLAIKEWRTSVVVYPMWCYVPTAVYESYD